MSLTLFNHITGNHMYLWIKNATAQWCLQNQRVIYLTNPNMFKLSKICGLIVWFLILSCWTPFVWLIPPKHRKNHHVLMATHHQSTVSTLRRASFRSTAASSIGQRFIPWQQLSCQFGGWFWMISARFLNWRNEFWVWWFLDDFCPWLNSVSWFFGVDLRNIAEPVDPYNCYPGHPGPISAYCFPYFPIWNGKKSEKKLLPLDICKNHKIFLIFRLKIRTCKGCLVSHHHRSKMHPTCWENAPTRLQEFAQILLCEFTGLGWRGNLIFCGERRFPPLGDLGFLWIPMNSCGFLIVWICLNNWERSSNWFCWRFDANPRKPTSQERVVQPESLGQNWAPEKLQLEWLFWIAKVRPWVLILHTSLWTKQDACAIAFAFPDLRCKSGTTELQPLWQALLARQLTMGKCKVIVWKWGTKPNIAIEQRNLGQAQMTHAQNWVSPLHAGTSRKRDMLCCWLASKYTTIIHLIRNVLYSEVGAG